MPQYQNFTVLDGSQLQTVSDGLRIVSLAELKAQMRVEESDEDTLILTYGRAAEQAILTATRRTIAELDAIGYEEINGTEPDGDPGITYFPAPLKVAILMHAAHMYRNRETTSTVAVNVVPYTLDSFVKPYTRLSDD